MRVVFTIFILVITLTACDKQCLSPHALVSYVEDPANGLRFKKVIKPLEYTLQYRPVDYIAAKESRGNDLEKGTLEKSRKELSGLQYYSLRIASGISTDVLMTGLTAEREYFDRTSYLAFDFQNDISMVEGPDTIPCTLYHFENTYGAAPFINFVIAFEKKEKERAVTDKIILIEDRVFGNGTVRFEVSKEDINNTPTLITY